MRPQKTLSEEAGERQKIELEITAHNFEFDKKSFVVPRSAEVTLHFHNQDHGVPHNFALYSDSSTSKSYFRGEIFPGAADRTYRFNAPDNAGTYYFQCDVHPQMNGDFIVE